MQGSSQMDYGDEEYGDEDIDEDTYMELMKMKQAKELQLKQAEEEKKKKENNKGGKKMMPSGLELLLPPEKVKSPDKNSFSKNSGQSSTKSAKEEYMRKKLGEKQESLPEAEAIEDFEEFALLDTKKEKSISKDSR